MTLVERMISNAVSEATWICFNENQAIRVKLMEKYEMYGEVDCLDLYLVIKILGDL